LTGVAVDNVMTRNFAVTWDYRCPFARNAHEHILTGLAGGADWNVRFLVFSLEQTHVQEGQPSVWEEPDRYPGLLANLAGVVVRDHDEANFPNVHRALFSARHDQALDLREREVVEKVLNQAGVDGPSVLSEVDQPWPLEVLRAEHTDAVDRLSIFGVPTFVSDDRAVFVRLMDRPGEDAGRAISTVDRVLHLLESWPELNEFKHTSISR
jgi:DSBA-like thioredoxin domain